MRRKTSKIIIPVLISLLAYLFLDYLNIPTLVGLSPANINSELFGILFDSAIVLILYVISFYYIENRQNEKDENARDTVNVLLEKTYKECLDNLLFLDNRAMVKEYIIPKVDGNKTDSENKVIRNLQTLPFTSLDAVIELAVGGYIEKNTLDNYLDIKKEYQYLISVKITFYDLVEPQTADQLAMYNDIHARDDALKRKLQYYLQLKK